VSVGGARSPPFTISTITYKVEVYRTLQLRGQTHSPYFYSNPMCALWCRQYELDLSKELDITCPIRVIHGLQDTEIDPAESLQVNTKTEALKEVLRIILVQDILVRDIWVRIRIRGSVPLTI
jgi:hypothetical protein